MKKYDAKTLFKRAYRLARQPDRYLTDDIDGVNRFFLDVPLKFFVLAESCLVKRGES